MSELDAIVNQNTLSPLAGLAAIANGLYNFGGVMGLPSLHELLSGTVGQQPPTTVNAANAPQIPETPGPVQPSRPAVFQRGAPGTQSGFAVGDPNAIPPAKPGTPLSANTAGVPGFPGAQSGTGWGRPDRPYPPWQGAPSQTQVATGGSKPAVADPPPPMPKPTADARPDLPGQPGAKEPDPTQWGVSHSPLQDLISRAMTRLENQQPIDKPTFDELPKPVPQQVQNSWMATVLSSAGLLLAAFGSRRSAAPMTAAIKSFGGYLQGYNEGQQEVWKQKQAEYKEQLDYALQRNQLELDRYKVAVEAAKGDTEKMHEMLYAASILNEDERGRAMIEQGRLDEFFKWTEAHQKWWDDVTAVRDKERLLGVSLPEPPEPVMPEDLRGYIYGGGGGGTGRGGAVDIAVGVESSGRPTVTGPDTSSGPSRGLLQITDGTWKQFASPDVQRKWPTADQAPPEVQIAVGKTIPVNRWGPKTQEAWHKAFGDFDENQTLGELERQHPGGGTQVAGPGGGTTPQPATSGGGTTPQPATSDQVATDDSPVAQLGRQIFRGENPPAGTDEDEKKYASAYAQNLQKKLSAVAASGLKGQALIDAVRKIDPDTADRLPAIVAGREPLTGTDSYSNSLATIATKLKTGWTRGQYKANEDLREYFNKGPPGQVMQRAGGLATAAAGVLEAINGLKTEDQTVIHNAIQELWTYGVTGDPKFYRLAAAIQQYDTESTAVAMQGVPRVALINDLLKLTPGHASPQALRQVLLTNLRGDYGKIQSVIGTYRTNFPDEANPPMLDVTGTKAIDQLLQHTDIRTGYINLPDDQMSSIIKDAQRRFSPEDQEAYDWAVKNPNDPRAAQILQHLGGQ